MDYIQRLYAERIGGKEFGNEKDIYKFEKIKRAKRQADIDNKLLPMIDLGVGEPDDLADAGIIEALYAAAGDIENRGYADNGILEYKEAAAQYLSEVYGVDHISADQEVLHVIGTKSALALIPQAFINPGDVTLITVPGYPILGTMTEWLGGEVYPLPLREENHFLPKLSEIPYDIRRKAKLLYLNYPNNPTGAIADKEFFEEVIKFAVENQLLVVHDAAYGALVFGNHKPLSFLSVPGAKEVGIEVHSMSKAFNMTGWRLGFIAGNEKAVKAIAMVKDNNDSGQFRAIQKAGSYALRHPELTAFYCEKYDRRHNKLTQVFSTCGFSVTAPSATFYEYIQIPKGTKDGQIFNTAEGFSDYLIRRVKISTVPWDDAGAYFRVSVTFAADTIEKEDEVLGEIQRRLQECGFLF